MLRATGLWRGLVLTLCLAVIPLAGCHQGASSKGTAGSASAAPSAAPSSRPADLPTSTPTDTAASASAAPALMPDGKPVPDLPEDAPTRVGFGVVLLTYRGAEGAPEGARQKDEALAQAKALVPEAMKDFAAAVKKGDRGSIEDAGTMVRGVLDPMAEYALFTLKTGAVHPEPLDTARGYWVVRRLR